MKFSILFPYIKCEIFFEVDSSTLRIRKPLKYVLSLIQTLFFRSSNSFKFLFSFIEKLTEILRFCFLMNLQLKYNRTDFVFKEVNKYLCI